MNGRADAGTAVPLTPVEDADAAIADAVEPYRRTPAVRAVSFVSKLSDQPPLRALCAALFAAGAAGGNPRLARAALRMLAAHTLATLAKDFVKRRVDRRRPNARRTDDDHRIAPGRRTAKEDTSFPSGHSAGAIAVAAAFAREFPRHGTASLAAGGALSVAQVARGSHYPSDVAAGLAIGAVSEFAVDRLLRLAPPAPWPFADPGGRVSPEAGG